MRGEIGIIGGSGVYQIDGVKVIHEHTVTTPFGDPSDKILELDMQGVKIFFLARHGRRHTLLPHEVNYRANIYALKALGVKYCLAVSAVGSLIEECPPGSLVLPDQFIDWTKGKRERSFFGNGIIGHVSTAHPINKRLQGMIAESCKKTAANFKQDGTYICIEGPQFSTRAESFLYKSFGASIIGMTNVPESYLAAEAAMAFATIAMVTDYDCWKEDHCNVAEIMKVMKSNNLLVHKVLKDLIATLNEDRFEFVKENIMGIMSPMESLNQQQREVVQVLTQ